MELFSDQPGDEGLPGAERRLAMIAVMMATTMAVFDGTIVNVALPQITRELGASVGTAIWVTNGYLLAMAMTLATFASLSSRVGFRTLFSAGLAVFTLASLGCALSPTVEVLIAMRVLQGLGGAAMLSIAPAIHRTVFPNRLLGRILGLNAVLIATSTAVGPALGGTLLAALSWQWLFAINVPLGLAAVWLSLRVIPGARVRTGEPFDMAGAVLSAIAMGAMILAAEACAQLAHGAQAGQALLGAVGFGLASVVAAVAFVRVQRRARQPLLPLDIFASVRFSLAALTSLASFVGQGIAFVALPFLFQNAYGYSAFESALLFTPWPIGIVLVAPHAGRLADRHSPALLSTAGLALFTVGLALLALLPDQAQAWDIGWRALVCGMGFGFFQSPNNREMLGNVSRERSGNASGVLAIMRTFGQCMGAALLGIVLSVYTAAALSQGHAQMNAAEDAVAIRVALWVAVAATAVATFVSISRIRAARSALSG
ncbi:MULTISPECIES: MFS transporter [unclassified Herbaspirillum]|uniref:MFS transporter n=1 Tax=unclassified Herbaspirillum TaxID=2624150 RepID=UPI0011512928|nr:MULTISPECIES: MFS transporter [unclassified Herbaspirillum]MBB5390655.1 DHA2 family multidrug resistance protein-like MFS transporter [Herbaspirillum sp. SJZ102]TQK08859.1 DHA2 family multidrug resistance protein-like MFS transporter [Herbaspirillum sp. SJZ130]TQK14454.1 DHA2 family multidrug resistance protein-like MFS transporter [Herbaspirillum sp. SJZ106]